MFPCQASITITERYGARGRSRHPQWPRCCCTSTGKTHTAVFELCHDSPHPAEHRIINTLYLVLGRHLDQIPMAQFVAHVPVYALYNDVAVKVPILEKGTEAARESHSRPRRPTRLTYAPNAT